MRRILTEPGVANIRRFGLGNILNWEMLAEIDKSLGYLEKKQNKKKPRDILCKEKKKAIEKVLL